jgi:hypothetical protein
MSEQKIIDKASFREPLNTATPSFLVGTNDPSLSQKIVTLTKQVVNDKKRRRLLASAARS